MKPIWYFVGLILTVMGLIIFAAGITYLISGETPHTILGNTHPNLWWGAVMTAAGLIFIFTNKNKIIN